MNFAFLPFSSDAFSSIAGTNIRLVYDSSILLDSVNLQGAGPNTLIETAYDTPAYFFGPSQDFSFKKNEEYTLEFNTICRKRITGFEGKMEVYLVGDAFPTFEVYGTKIGTLTSDSGLLFQPFGTVSINFKAKRTGTAKLRFVLYGGQWHVSDVSLKIAEEFGYTPNDASILAPLVGFRKDLIQFKVELYDANNNILPIPLNTAPTFFNGGNLVISGEDNKLTGRLTVAGTNVSSSIVVTATGYSGSDGVYVPSGSAIYMGTGIPKNNDTPFFVGQTPLGVSTFSIRDTFYVEELANGSYDIQIGSGSNVTVSVGDKFKFDGTSIAIHDPSILVDSLPVASGVKTGRAQHNVRETFNGVPFSIPPHITFTEGGLSFHPSLVNWVHGPSIEAIDVDVNGFTPYAVMRVEVTSSAVMSSSFSGNNMVKSSPSQSYDKMYTYVYDVNVSAPTGSNSFSSMTLYFYSSINSSSISPTLRAVRTYTNTSASNASYTDQRVTVGLNTMGSGSLFRLIVGRQVGAGGTVTPQRIEWTEATNVTEYPMTNSTFPYTAISGI